MSKIEQNMQTLPRNADCLIIKQSCILFIFNQEAFFNFNFYVIKKSF